MTIDAPTFTVISWGIELPFRGIFIISRLATAFPFRTASGMAIAFPIPAPTLPSPSPMTTRALNRSLRPPFTTFAIRLVNTTRSVIFDPSSPYVLGIVLVCDDTI